MLEKIISIIIHSNYSYKIILPKNFCKFLKITSKDKLIATLDKENDCIIMRKKGKINEK